MDFKTGKGKPTPLGATVTEGGVNFAIFSQHAKALTLCLFDFASKKPLVRLTLDPKTNRTGYIWHIEIEKLPLPTLYVYMIDGPPGSPHYYTPERLLLDPYATDVGSEPQWGVSKGHYTPYGVVDKPQEFDWQNVASPLIPIKDAIMYEMHVRAFTQDPSSHSAHPGSFLGVVEKIPHLLSLGINTIELMPIFEFDECENDHNLCNFWGYSSFNFFTPTKRFGSVNDFKTMVRELHKNGIEVILDVVYNHTGEKRAKPGFLSFMGIDHSIYFLLEKGADTNFSGCGNTMNLNHPVGQQLVIDSLHYWVSEMHVDGFRFDLGAILNRDMQGHLVPLSSIVKRISLDPVLAKTKLIAEPWDAAGAYQLGSFFPSACRWAEWNGKYRDAVRCFLKGDPFSKNAFAERIVGSESTFPYRSPQASMNFITAHDGFTLADLVAYNEKHNTANGEEGRDGTDNNMSWNMGAEGVTDDPNILALRERQMRNFVLVLFLSQGIPMFSMGDEYGHTKEGNNNTYCQDNKLTWFQWDKIEGSRFFSFVKQVIAFRKENPLLSMEHFLGPETIQWHGMNVSEPGWEHPDPLIAFNLVDHKNRNDLYAAFNATSGEVCFNLPPPPEGKQWHLIFDSRFDERKNEVHSEPQYTLASYSCAVLKSL